MKQIKANKRKNVSGENFFVGTAGITRMAKRDSGKTDDLKGRTIRNTLLPWLIYLTIAGVFCSQLVVQSD